ncbi:hypothetical protein B0O80DRAFT_493583 [Mortierella sp. GBAus27b]|nr:hypothetical protein BGX31_001215 [Mortierella sp. GBA43]KAI8360951.1 hypothetical protein B0O80DRAFT_493583 [Mortierella sp. GBAus27b]
MSFFRKDYSAYPQPVLVKPDPRYAAESISVAVADAIDHDQAESSQAGPRAGRGTEPPVSIVDSILSDTLEQGQQPKDTTKVADGIMSLLGPIVQEMDFNIVSVRKSQTELEKEIERLMAELQLFMASAAAPPEVEPAVQKLLKARRKIMAANTTLKAVQERVDRMSLQVEKLQ